jgi:hypothetical protein
VPKKKKNQEEKAKAKSHADEAVHIEGKEHT